jgi:hypothetical protein
VKASLTCVGNGLNWRIWTVIIFYLLANVDKLAAQENHKSNSDMILEIRTYTLKHGTRDRFQQLFEKTMPLLKKWNITVVSYGPSMHDENSYYLIRKFSGIAERERLEEAFYNSKDWKEGSREGVLSLIEVYCTVVVPEVVFATKAQGH